jgi:hypothetical protein
MLLVGAAVFIPIAAAYRIFHMVTHRPLGFYFTIKNRERKAKYSEKSGLGPVHERFSQYQKATDLAKTALFEIRIYSSAESK